MATPTPEHTRRRRRGPQLESALLDAAWDELVEVGFASLTMESVAARAQTGIAVLYQSVIVLAAIVTGVRLRVLVRRSRPEAENRPEAESFARWPQAEQVTAP